MATILTIEQMKKIAEERGGLCLSEAYINAHTKLLWECAEGHRWEAIPNSIQRGTWCPICGIEKVAAKQRLNIEEMQKIAEERGGHCLSLKYKNSHSKLHWRCNEGHEWQAAPTGIKSGKWCPICANKVRADGQRLDIKEMQKIAEERGGRCLSTSYKTARQKLRWECAEGHQWQAVPYSIKNGTWCPECKIGFGERVCRAFFEQIFHNNFPKLYPKWLINEKGNQMELDGYCETLSLAFEHHGQQHYNISTPFIKDNKRLKQIRENDELKKRLCKQHGVCLIEIPEIGTLLKIDELKSYIKAKCIEEKFSLPTGYDEVEVNFNEPYFTNFLKNLQYCLGKKWQMFIKKL